MQKLSFIAMAASFVCAACAHGQIAASTPATNAGHSSEVIANGGLLHTLEAAPVTGQPYSALQVQRMVRTLADGTTIKNGPGPGHAVMRDSLGRVRIEQRITRATPEKPSIFLVFVMDPVEHTMSMWSTSNKGEKVATIFKLPARPAQPASSSGVARMEQPGRLQPTSTTEDLGTDVLEGVSVSVVKTTIVVPAGRVGNDAPITRTHETWTSPDMKLTLKEEWSDPRTGDKTVWLKDLSRVEPAAEMFRAPAGYKTKTLTQTMEELAQKLASTPD